MYGMRGRESVRYILMKKTRILVEIDGREIPVAIENKRNRNMYLRVRQGGEVLLTCPSYVTRGQAVRFLRSKEDWLTRALCRMSEKEAYIRTGADGGPAVLFGREFPIEWRQKDESRLLIASDRLIYFMREWDPERVSGLFYQEAAKMLTEQIGRERFCWDQKICTENSLSFPEITVKHMTSRWGSCTPAKNHISISSRLVHFPAGCISYVLLHEYAHLLVPNHSAEFYAVIEKFMPDYRERRAMLK